MDVVESKFTSIWRRGADLSEVAIVQLVAVPRRHFLSLCREVTPATLCYSHTLTEMSPIYT